MGGSPGSVWRNLGFGVQQFGGFGVLSESFPYWAGIRVLGFGGLHASRHRDRVLGT